MAKENLEYSVNDLERVKFTPESNTDNSVVQTSETNEVPLLTNHNEIICALTEITRELKKINLAIQFSTGNDITDQDIEGSEL